MAENTCPVAHVLELEVLHRRAGNDKPVKPLALDLVKGLIEGPEVFHRRVLGGVGRGLQQHDLHLQRRVPQHAQELRFGDNFCGHEVQYRNAKRPDVLV